MRTTLEIEDDVLLAAKELARLSHTSTGRVISDLVRRALTQSSPAAGDSVEEPAVHGFRPFPRRGGVVTNERVDKLRDEDGL